MMRVLSIFSTFLPNLVASESWRRTSGQGQGGAHGQPAIQARADDSNELLERSAGAYQSAAVAISFLTSHLSKPAA